jgi:amino acid transporter
MSNETTHPELFARKASGLVREFGFFDTFVFNTICYAIGLVLAVTPFFAGALFPNANMYLVLIFGTILALFNGWTYSMLSGTMPRSGGEYVYNGRILHPAIGFMTNWGLTWSVFLALGIYTQWTINYGLAVSFATVGYGMGSEAILNAGTWISGPWPTFLISTGAIVSVILIMSAGMRFLKRFLNILFIIAFVGTIVTLGVFLANSRADFIEAFNAFMAKAGGLEDAYNAMMQLARDNGWQSVPQSLGGALMALPLGYWVYVGFTYSAYVGGEVKEPQKTQMHAIIGSLLVGFVVYMVILGRYYAVVGTDFNNAAAFLEYNTDANPLPVAGVMNFFAGLLTQNPVWLILMGLSFFLWHYLLLFIIFAICTRNMFAWAFDKLMPLSLTKVTEKTRIPLTAMVVAAILGWILLWLSIFTPLFDYVFNYIAIFSIAFWVTSFAAILLPYRRRELFDFSSV